MTLYNRAAELSTGSAAPYYTLILATTKKRKMLQEKKELIWISALTDLIDSVNVSLLPWGEN